jgi:hypothetical protein
MALCWGIRNPQALDAHGGIDYQSTYIIDFYIEHVPFYHGPLTLYEECYSACMCIPGRVITMDSDGSGPYWCS